MAGDVHAGLGVLAVARAAWRPDHLPRLSHQLRQQHDLGPAAQQVEIGTRGRTGKVIDVHVPRQRQRGDQSRAGGERLMRHQLVAALGQCGHHHQRQRGKVAPELRQEIPHALPDRLDFVRGDIAMAGDADDQGSHDGFRTMLSSLWAPRDLRPMSRNKSSVAASPQCRTDSRCMTRCGCLRVSCS